MIKIKKERRRRNNMKFQEITEKEYKKFWEKHPLKTFLSAPEIAKLREKSNWITYYVGVKEKDK